MRFDCTFTDRNLHLHRHRLTIYDNHFDTIASLEIGNFKYTIRGNETKINRIQNKYAEQLVLLNRKYTKNLTKHTHFFVDTIDIPELAGFKSNQEAIASGVDESDLPKKIH